ncbi:NlpC/P60 family protein [Micromonospora sonneratiae]|uniref:NlpC/P60 family protein n=1 Tax=Micromonospora sonneratiae TaxID=1184706 RepID=A0ABW3Y6F3_9ACTN
MTVALALVPVPALAEPPDEPVPERVTASADGLEALVNQHNDLQEELRATRDRADALTEELLSLERRLAANRGRVGQVAVAAYRVARPRSMATVLPLSPAGRRMDPLLKLERLSRERAEVITDLSRSHQRLTAARRTTQLLLVRQRDREHLLSARVRQIEAEIAKLNQARDAAAAPESPAEPPPALASAAGAKVVRFAYAQLGKNYRWAGSGPDGYDCSGLTSAAWATVGVKLPHNAAQQWRTVNRIKRTELRPGDLVFYYRDIGHVAIYVGAGKVIHAPRPGKRIRIDETDFQPIHGYGRPR